MKGLHILKNDYSIDKSSGNPSCIYELKAMDKGHEVILMTSYAEALLVCQQNECSGALNTYFILEGSVEEQNSKSVLKAGDCFTIKDIETTLFFKVLEKSKILWIINKNIFDELAYENRVIEEVLKNVQEKDKYTHEHCKRVGHLSRQIARKMGLTEKRIVNTILAALCHDAGKINVPEEILQKPSRLTEEEYEIIKRHPKDGADIVMNELNEEIARIVEQHHERLDGKGYPYGLKGNEIILEAKILAVVDSFDAMITDRPYRKGISMEAALTELRRCAGTYYESEIVEKFIEVLQEDNIL